MWNLLNIHRIRYKLIITTLVLCLSLLSIGLYITYRSSTNIIKSQSVALNNKLVELGKSKLESYMDEVDKIYRSLYLSKEFSIFTPTESIEDNFGFINTYTNVKNLLHTFINTRQDIFSIVYVDKRGFLLYITQKEAGYSRHFNWADVPDWFNAALSVLQNENVKVILPTHDHIPLDLKVTAQGEKVLSIARSIINIDQDYKVLGTMFINLDLSTLRKLSSEIKPYPDALTYILDKDGTIIYDSSEKENGGKIDSSIMKTLNNEASGKIQLKLQDRQWMSVYTTSEALGWKIINFIPVSEYASNISFISEIVLLICIFAVIISIFIVYLISRHISKPIEKLTQIMRKIDIGNMDIRADESGRDEIGILARSLNHLIAKLDHAIKNEYETGLRQKDAEMSALQSQINPHFLNNVLQSISAIAKVNLIDEINVMANSLGKMLRYNIRTNENRVSLMEECEHVKSYLAIQKIRFGDKLDYYLSIQEHLLEQSILKFMLQPIVENAILHGFEDKTDQGIVQISCRQQDDSILIDISDNGKGISPERIAWIFSGNSVGIGLYNVMKRLELLYEGKASFQIESEENIGTSVIIQIPAYFRKEGLNNVQSIDRRGRKLG